MMTCAERMRRIKMMERLERLYESGSDRVEKTENGDMKYYDSNNDVMVEFKMVKKN